MLTNGDVMPYEEANKSFLTYGNYAKVLKEMKLFNFPRKISLGQYLVTDYYALLYGYFIPDSKRNRDLYISANSYYDFDKNDKPENIFVTKSLIDLDVAYQPSIEVAYKECKRLMEYFEDHKLDYRIQFSGGGYHFLPTFYGKLYTHSSEGSEASSYIKALHDFLIEEMKSEGHPLKSINNTADAPRMMRMPFSVHQKYRRYCIPLPQGSLSYMSHKDILKESYKPSVKSLLEGKKKALTITKTLNFLNIKKPKKTSCIKSPNGKGMVTTDITDKKLLIYIKMLIPYPCLNTLLQDKNPMHCIRYNSCVHLRKVLGKEACLDLFDKMAEGFKWNDRHNRLKRESYIRNIYDNQYEKMKSCKDVIRDLNLKNTEYFKSFDCSKCPKRGCKK